MAEWQLALMLAFIAASPGILALLLNRRKDVADAKKLEQDATHIIVNTVLELLQPLREECKSLVMEKEDIEKQLDKCRAELAKCKAEAE